MGCIDVGLFGYMHMVGGLSGDMSDCLSGGMSGSLSLGLSGDISGGMLKRCVQGHGQGSWGGVYPVIFYYIVYLLLHDVHVLPVDL